MRIRISSHGKTHSLIFFFKQKQSSDKFLKTILFIACSSSAEILRRLHETSSKSFMTDREISSENTHNVHCEHIVVTCDYISTSLMAMFSRWFWCIRRRIDTRSEKKRTRNENKNKPRNENLEHREWKPVYFADVLGGREPCANRSVYVRCCCNPFNMVMRSLVRSHYRLFKR